MVKIFLNYIFVVIFLVMFLAGCKGKDKYIWKPLDVEVSAYNSVPSQTLGDPNIGAWGDTLSYRQKSIAVSRDLIEMGLGHNSKVMIEGLPGVYLVKDKMAARWKKRVDIFMGDKVEKAKKWGVKKLSIVYAVEKEAEASNDK